MLPLSFFFVTSVLQALNTVILNFSNQAWKLFFFFLIGHILVLIVFSVILKAIASFVTKASKDTSFSKIVEGTSVALAVPSFYVSNILLFIYAIWGPQKIWMMWIDPLVLIFVINSIVIVFIVKIVLLTKMFKNLVGTTKLKSTLASLLSILIPLDFVLVGLWIIGAELWNDIIHFLHNVFNLFFSTMFDRGPGAGAWISITIGQLSLFILVVSLVISIILSFLEVVNRRKNRLM